MDSCHLLTLYQVHLLENLIIYIHCIKMSASVTLNMVWYSVIQFFIKISPTYIWCILFLVKHFIFVLSKKSYMLYLIFTKRMVL